MFGELTLFFHRLSFSSFALIYLFVAPVEDIEEPEPKQRQRARIPRKKLGELTLSFHRLRSISFV
jgi:hypothetical protein